MLPYIAYMDPMGNGLYKSNNSPRCHQISSVFDVLRLEKHGEKSCPEVICSHIIPILGRFGKFGTLKMCRRGRVGVPFPFHFPGLPTCLSRWVTPLHLWISGYQWHSWRRSSSPGQDLWISRRFPAPNGLLLLRLLRLLKWIHVDTLNWGSKFI